ncbi:hypothetical protein LTR86_006559 [Recurvomyces mirabilis]|nr:hypothetical protein LTR86_006559 [Recurvomyces mirabilis]
MGGPLTVLDVEVGVEMGMPWVELSVDVDVTVDITVVRLLFSVQVVRRLELALLSVTGEVGNELVRLPVVVILTEAELVDGAVGPEDVLLPVLIGMPVTVELVLLSEPVRRSPEVDALVEAIVVIVIKLVDVTVTTVTFLDDEAVAGEVGKLLVALLGGPYGAGRDEVEEAVVALNLPVSLEVDELVVGEDTVEFEAVITGDPDVGDTEEVVSAGPEELEIATVGKLGGP